MYRHVLQKYLNKPENIACNQKKKKKKMFRHNAGINCTPPAIEDFPHDLFDEKQRQAGAVVVHVIVSLYLFIALAVVCDKFFVPAVEKICHGKKNPLIN